MFKRIIVQYELLRKRGAFLEQYKKEAPFADGLGEFDQAKASLVDLIAEYEAAEKEDYLNPVDLRHAGAHQQQQHGHTAGGGGGGGGEG